MGSACCCGHRRRRQRKAQKRGDPNLDPRSEPSAHGKRKRGSSQPYFDRHRSPELPRCNESTRCAASRRTPAPLLPRCLARPRQRVGRDGLLLRFVSSRPKHRRDLWMVLVLPAVRDRRWVRRASLASPHPLPRAPVPFAALTPRVRRPFASHQGYKRRPEGSLLFEICLRVFVMDFAMEPADTVSALDAVAAPLS